MSNTTFRPQNDRVVLTLVEPAKQSKGGIIIPDQAQQKTQRGTIQAVGPGKLLQDGTRSKIDLQVGDTVQFRRYAGEEIQLDGQDYFVVGADDILLVLNT